MLLRLILVILTWKLKGMIQLEGDRTEPDTTVIIPAPNGRLIIGHVYFGAAKKFQT
jgi:hypothetical protein